MFGAIVEEHKVPWDYLSDLSTYLRRVMSRSPQLFVTTPEETDRSSGPLELWQQLAYYTLVLHLRAFTCSGSEKEHLSCHHHQLQTLCPSSRTGRLQEFLYRFWDITNQVVCVCACVNVRMCVYVSMSAYVCVSLCICVSSKCMAHTSMVCMHLCIWYM